jgi:23S rRNA pseudouridine1911/1915/1917 synthase
MSEPQTQFTVGSRDGGKRLDLFLKERIPGLSRARLQEAIRTRITLSWEAAVRPATPVRPGGTVEVGWVPLPEEPLAIELPVLVRGEGWLAVDKPSGIPVHPVNRVRENSLIRMLRRQEGEEGLRLVHRLDRETTGVLLIAGGPDTARALSLAFERGRVAKEYLALVAGEIAGEEGTIDLPIGEASGRRVYVRREAGSGQPARTRWRVERRLPGRTVLRLFPETGRRHQLRVHLAAIGHPILGDILYGRPDRDYLDMVTGVRDARREEGGPTRQLLHCARLGFADPVTSQARVVVAPLPPDFALEASMPETLQQFLERDHARLDALLRRADADPGKIDVEAYEAFRAGLLRHIAMEEKVLLPEARRLRGGEPLAVAKRLRADHAALASLLVPTPTHEIVATIRRVLTEHNPLEEGPGGAYDACQRLAGAELEALTARLRAVPEVALAPHVDDPQVREHIDRLLLARSSSGAARS